VFRVRIDKIRNMSNGREMHALSISIATKPRPQRKLELSGLSFPKHRSPNC
jgi:hypothetical protein